VAEFPQLSVAVYVYERDLEQPVPASALSAEEVTEGEPVQLSEAVAVPAVGKDDGLQSSEEEAGHAVNTGASVSAV
jgi:hypothetical protein